ncbi:MAG: hypothetical protein JWP63_3718 [Candidatus Solibacter sp.]|nr:hypothetical protein [Candidatus Solibacter sp.]
MSAATRKLLALHLVANALLLWLAYEWLGVTESTRFRLVLSAVDALAILSLVCWLHGATFVYFRGKQRIKDAFRVALRHLGALVVAAVVVIVVYGLLTWAANAMGQPAFQLASWMTLHLRKPVKPSTVARVFQGVFWVVRWVVLPVGLLPMASGIAARGGRGAGEITWRAGWRDWVVVPAALLLGLKLPFVLLGWVPAVEAFGMQMASFVVRIGVGYLLFVGAAVGLAYWTGARRMMATSADPS